MKKKTVNPKNYIEDWREHNRSMRRKHMHDMVFKDVEDYIAYRFGRVKVNKTFKELTVSKSYRLTDKANSLMESGRLPKATVNTTAKPDSKTYTGTYIIGISTTHKSNAVPVTSKEQATDISRMRR